MDARSNPFFFSKRLVSTVTRRGFVWVLDRSASFWRIHCICGGEGKNDIDLHYSFGFLVTWVHLLSSPRSIPLRHRWNTMGVLLGLHFIWHVYRHTFLNKQPRRGNTNFSTFINCYFLWEEETTHLVRLLCSDYVFCVFG